MESNLAIPSYCPQLDTLMNGTRLEEAPAGGSGVAIPPTSPGWRGGGHRERAEQITASSRRLRRSSHCIQSSNLPPYSPTKCLWTSTRLTEGSSRPTMHASSAAMLPRGCCKRVIQEMQCHPSMQPIFSRENRKTLVLLLF